MRARIFPLLAIVTLAATPALAQKVSIDYAHDFDFKAVKTFTFVDSPGGKTGNDMMDDRIKSKIIAKLEAGGLEEVESGGDLNVTYNVSTKDNTVHDTTVLGYGGWGPGWGPWGHGGQVASTTMSTTFTEGTLVIDAYEPAGKKLVWRGTGTGTLKSTPEKRSKQVDRVIENLSRKWKRILKGKGR